MYKAGALEESEAGAGDEQPGRHDAAAGRAQEAMLQFENAIERGPQRARSRYLPITTVALCCMTVRARPTTKQV